MSEFILMPKPPHDAVLAGMRAYLQTLHEWSAVDETLMKGLHYLPIEECMSRWGISLREKKVRVKPVDGTVSVEVLNLERRVNDMLRAENAKLRAQIGAMEELLRLQELPKASD